MRVDVDVSGFEEVSERFEALSACLMEAARKGLKAGMQPMVAQAKMLVAPTDNSTGQLRNSIGADAMVQGSYVVGDFHASAEYALYVEYGTGPKGEADHAGIDPDESPFYHKGGTTMQDGGINIPIIVSAEQALGLLDEFQQALLTAGESGETMKAKLEGLGKGIERALGEAGERARLLEQQLEAVNRRIESQSKIRDNLQGKLDRALFFSKGSETDETLKLQDNIAKLDQTLAKLEAESNKTAKALADVDDEMVRLKVSSETVGKAAEQAGQSMQDAGEKGKQGTEAAAAGAEKATLAYAAMAAAALKGFQIIVGAVQTGIDAHNRYEAAITGLQSVAASKGIGGEKIAASANQVTDALLDAGSSATALKNLLLRGFSEEQAVQSINRLKDAAAFGRQGTMSLSEAVVSATEGIKNGNSILVDNAGVTKNLAKMQEEYAASLGVTVSSLTEAQKAEAEYLGIMKETEPMLGDAAKLTEKLAGAQQDAAMQGQLLTQSYGSSMEPVVQLLTELFGNLLGGLNDFVSTNPEFVAGLSSGTAAILALVAAGKGLSVLGDLKKWLDGGAAALNAFGISATTANVALGGIGLVVGVAVAAYTAWKKAQDEAAEAERQQAEDVKASIAATEEKRDSVRSLADEYNTLITKEGRTIAENQRIKQIEEQLSSQYGITSSEVDGLAGSYDSLTQSMEAYIQAQNESLVADTRLALKLGRSDMPEQKKDIEALADAYNELNEQIESEERLVANRQKHESTKSERDDWKEERDRLKAELDQAIIDNATIDAKVSQAWDYIMAATNENGTKLNAAMIQVAQNAFEAFADENPGEAVADGFLEKFIEALSQLDIPSLTEGLSLDKSADGFDAQVSELTRRVMAALEEMNGTFGSEEWALFDSASADDMTTAIMSFIGYAKNAEGAWEAVGSAAGDAGRDAADGVDLLAAAMSNVNAAMNETGGTVSSLEDIRSQYQSIREEIEALQAEGGNEARIAQLQSEADSLEQQYDLEQQLLEVQQERLEKQLEELEALQDENGDKEEQLEISIALLEVARELAATEAAKLVDVDAAEDLPEKVDPAIAALNKLGVNATDLQRRVQNLGRQRDLNNLLKDMATQAKATKQPFDQFVATLPKTAQATAKAAGGFDAFISGLEKTGDALDTEAANIDLEIQAITAAVYEAYGVVDQGAHGDVTLEGSQAKAEADSLIAWLTSLLALMDSSNTSGKKKGGGGGGGKKSSGSSSPAREENEALEEQLRILERRKRMGEVNTRQEIAELERIMATYVRTAEERLQLEDKIFEARARLRDEEISQIDRLNDGILTALRNRYEEEQRLENERLDGSVQAWRDWADETVAAIQAQMDALDEAEKQEDRDAKTQKALRKIEERKMTLLYETDDFARRQLEQEIARLEEEWAKQLASWARDDERDRLQAQMDAVHTQADSEIAAIEEQRDAVNDMYEQLLSGASLQAEAQAMLEAAGQNQQDIIDLIGSYAPEYNATGQSLGEQLYNGLVSAMGGISNWFDAFSASIQEIQNQAAQASNQFAQQYYNGQTPSGQSSGSRSITVEQTNNFNVPVARPSAVSEALEETNEALAAQLAG